MKPADRVSSHQDKLNLTIKSSISQKESISGLIGSISAAQSGPIPLPVPQKHLRDCFVQDKNHQITKVILKSLVPNQYDKFALVGVNLFTNPYRSTETANPVVTSPKPLSINPNFWDFNEILLQHELANQDNFSDIKFHTSLIAQVFSHFCRLHGLDFLESCFGSLVREVIKVPGTWEIDPERLVSAVSRMAQAQAILLSNQELLAYRTAMEKGLEPPKRDIEFLYRVLNLLKSSPIVSWSVHQVVLWVHFGLKLPMYAHIFEENKITGSKLGNITGEMLTDWGLISIQDKTHILNNIRSLHDQNLSDSILPSGAAPSSSTEPNILSMAQEQLAQVIDEHVERLKQFCSRFISALQDPPSQICRVISQIYNFMKKKYDVNTARQVVTIISFSRFIIPSISAPDSFNLCESAPSGNSRRGLVLIAKLISQISKNTPFSESFLEPFNSFIAIQSKKCDKFVDSLISHASNSSQYKIPTGLEWKSHYYNSSNLTTMHALNNFHWILEELSEPIFEETMKETSNSLKKIPIWDKLVVILEHLGPVDHPTERHRYAVQKFKLQNESAPF